MYWYRTRKTQWYVFQRARCDSSSFKVANIVRQDEILSPKLSIVHTVGISVHLNNSNIGGNFGCVQLVNHISYVNRMDVS